MYRRRCCRRVALSCVFVVVQNTNKHTHIHSFLNRIRMKHMNRNKVDNTEYIFSRLYFGFSIIYETISNFKKFVLSYT